MWTYLYYKDVTITLDTEALKSKSSVYANWDQVLSIQYIQYMPSQFVFFFGGGGEVVWQKTSLRRRVVFLIVAILDYH